jgi:hypothetical protein
MHSHVATSLRTTVTAFATQAAHSRKPRPAWRFFFVYTREMIRSSFHRMSRLPPETSGLALLVDIASGEYWFAPTRVLK